MRLFIAFVIMAQSLNLVCQTSISSAFLNISQKKSNISIQCGEIFSPIISKNKFGILPILEKRSNNNVVLENQIWVSNPSNGDLLIGDAKKYNFLKIYNSQGSFVKSITIQNKFKIDVSDIDRGVYLLEFSQLNTVPIKLKWIKQ